MAVVAFRHSGYWNRELLESAEDVVLIELQATQLSAENAARYSRVYRVSDWSDMEKLGAIAGDLISDDVPVTMVYSPIEFTQEAAGYLRTVLIDRGGPMFTVLATRDKRVMKVVAARAGLATTTWRTVRRETVEQDVAQAIDELGLPLVAKPVDGFGSKDTLTISSDAALGAYAERFFGADSAPEMFVCERFVPGEEYHADAVLDNGDIVGILVSRYHVTPRDLRAGQGPDLSIGLDERFNAGLYAAVRESLVRFAKEAGLTAGAVHFEFFSDSVPERCSVDSLVFSEIGSRIGGGNISDLFGAYCGVNLRALTLAQGLGRDLGTLPWTPPPHPAIGLLNLTPSGTGAITALPSAEALAAEPGVLMVSIPAAVGTRFEAGVSSANWTVVLLVGAESVPALVDRCDELVAAHPILVE